MWRKINKGLLYVLVGIVTLGFGLSGCKMIKASVDYTKDGGVGNSQTNLMNGGIYAAADGYLYYRNHEDSGRLYRKPLDGTGEGEKLTDDENISFINAFGDWVFYVDNTEGGGNHAIRIKPDGSERTELNDVATTNLQVVRNVMGIYVLWYISMDDNYRVTMQQLDANQPVIQFITQGIYSFTMDAEGGKLYFMTGDEIRWVNISGIIVGANEGNSFLRRPCVSHIYHDKKLFYLEISDTRHSAAFKYKGTGMFGGSHAYKGLGAVAGLDYALDGKYVVFFNDDDSSLWRMNINGKNPEVIAEVPAVNTGYSTILHIIEGEVYLTYTTDGTAMHTEIFPLGGK